MTESLISSGNPIKAGVGPVFSENSRREVREPSIKLSFRSKSRGGYPERKSSGIPLIPLLFQPVAHMHPGQDTGYLGSLQPLSSIGPRLFSCDCLKVKKLHNQSTSMQNERKKANLKGNRVLVLASGSPRRTELLNSAGITHQVVVSKGEELKLHPDGPLELVKQNARIKAVEVSNRYPDHLILGADTIVSLNEKVLENPGISIRLNKCCSHCPGKPT